MCEWAAEGLRCRSLVSACPANRMILPGETIGVLGGGPLGRMLAQAAQTLGYRVHVFEAAGPSLAGAAANKEVNASFEDIPALVAFARECAVVTSEFENIPAASLEAIAAIVPLHPRSEALDTTQNRVREKGWLRANGFPHVRYAEALDGDIVSVIGQVGRPCVVKTADFGFDGKGQMKIASDADLEQASAIFRGRRCTLERWIDFSCELTVIVARSSTGETKAFPIAENIHTRHVLDVSIAPARIGAAVAREAEHLAITIAEKLNVVGLLAVEMFVAPNGAVLINELATRPHNSGHWTLDGCETSQFEQQIRAVCGLPLGRVEVRQPTVMVNILADRWRWREGRVVGEPNWSTLLSAPRVKLHLYGRTDHRPGRKMGHFTVRDTDAEIALVRAKELASGL
jgi:5-(carboxyamino)imidazole ribonucleotide synthase